MPIAQQDADAILAEFMQASMVQRIKAGKRGPRRLTSKPDLLVKQEFEPDNSRIGRQSKGMQSSWNPRVQWLLCMGLLDEAAKAMIADYSDARRGIVPWQCVVQVVTVDTPETISTEVKPTAQYFGEWNVPAPVRCLNNSEAQTKLENESWKSSRMPRTFRQRSSSR